MPPPSASTVAPLRCAMADRALPRPPHHCAAAPLHHGRLGTAEAGREEPPLGQILMLGKHAVGGSRGRQSRGEKEDGGEGGSMEGEVRGAASGMGATQ